MKKLLGIFYFLKYSFAFLIFAIRAILNRRSYLTSSKRILCEIFQFFTDKGVPIWLDGGSLLGQIREGNFILFDSDIDLSINHSDVSNSLKILEENGFKFVGLFEFSPSRPVVFKFVKYNVAIDISVFYPSPNGMVRYSPRLVNESGIAFFAHAYEFLGFCSIDIVAFESEDLNYNFPVEFDSYLTVYYGDWRQKINAYHYFMNVYYSNKVNNNKNLTKENKLIYVKVDR